MLVRRFGSLKEIVADAGEKSYATVCEAARTFSPFAPVDPIIGIIDAIVVAPTGW